MENTIIADLFGKQVVQSTPLATVTRDFVVIRDPDGQTHTIIALARLSKMKRITTTYPIFLVVSSGLSLIGAAAFFSKQGNGAGVPLAILAGAFAAGYLLSRKAAVAFVTGSETTETNPGSLSEATALIAAVQSAQVHLGNFDGGL